jgi:hypothetical protein
MNRNELITYIQMQRGMKMASVIYLDGRQENIAGERIKGEEPSQREYFYKVRPGAEIAVGDIWAAQARDTFALVKVTKVWLTPPSGVDLGAKYWKYLVSRVDVDGAQALIDEEAAVFEQLARIEMQTKMQEISQALGFDVSKVEIPSLPAE